MTVAVDVLKGCKELPGVEVKQILVTPDLAQEWVSNRNYKGQRIIRNHWFLELTRRIKDGEWVMNGDTIKFNADGELIDGQHRLYAIYESGIAVALLVATGLSKEAYAEIDNNRLARTPADFLRSEGEKDAMLLAPALNILRKIVTREILTSERSRVSPADLRDLLAKHPNIRMSVPVAKMGDIKKIMKKSVAVACHYMFTAQNSQLSDRFFEILSTGQCADSACPAIALYKALGFNRRDRVRAISIKTEWELAITIKAWNLFAANKPVKHLHIAKDEGFPEIDGFFGTGRAPKKRKY